MLDVAISEEKGVRVTRVVHGVEGGELPMAQSGKTKPGGMAGECRRVAEGTADPLPRPGGLGAVTGLPGGESADKQAETGCLEQEDRALKSCDRVIKILEGLDRMVKKLAEQEKPTEVPTLGVREGSVAETLTVGDHEGRLNALPLNDAAKESSGDLSREGQLDLGMEPKTVGTMTRCPRPEEGPHELNLGGPMDRLCSVEEGEQQTPRPSISGVGGWTQFERGESSSGATTAGHWANQEALSRSRQQLRQSDGCGGRLTQEWESQAAGAEPAVQRVAATLGQHELKEGGPKLSCLSMGSELAGGAEPRQQAEEAEQLATPTGKSGRFALKCFHCNGPHLSRECPRNAGVALAQTEGQREQELRCYRCDGPHKGNECPSQARMAITPSEDPEKQTEDESASPGCSSADGTPKAERARRKTGSSPNFLKASEKKEVHGQGKETECPGPLGAPRPKARPVQRSGFHAAPVGAKSSGPLVAPRQRARRAAPRGATRRGVQSHRASVEAKSSGPQDAPRRGARRVQRRDARRAPARAKSTGPSATSSQLSSGSEPLLDREQAKAEVSGQEGSKPVKCFLCEGPHKVRKCPQKIKLNAIKASAKKQANEPYAALGTMVIEQTAHDQGDHHAAASSGTEMTTRPEGTATSDGQAQGSGKSMTWSRSGLGSGRKGLSSGALAKTSDPEGSQPADAETPSAALAQDLGRFVCWTVIMSKTSSARQTVGDQGTQEGGGPLARNEQAEDSRSAVKAKSGANSSQADKAAGARNAGSSSGKSIAELKAEDKAQDKGKKPLVQEEQAGCSGLKAKAPVSNQAGCHKGNKGGRPLTAQRRQTTGASELKVQAQVPNSSRQQSGWNAGAAQVRATGVGPGRGIVPEVKQGSSRAKQLPGSGANFAGTSAAGQKNTKQPTLGKVDKGTSRLSAGKQGSRRKTRAGQQHAQASEPGKQKNFLSLEAVVKQTTRQRQYAERASPSCGSQQQAHLGAGKMPKGRQRSGRRNYLPAESQTYCTSTRTSTKQLGESVTRGRSSPLAPPKRAKHGASRHGRRLAKANRAARGKTQVHSKTPRAELCWQPRSSRAEDHVPRLDSKEGSRQDHAKAPCSRTTWGRQVDEQNSRAGRRRVQRRAQSGRPAKPGHLAFGRISRQEQWHAPRRAATRGAARRAARRSTAQTGSSRRNQGSPDPTPDQSHPRPRTRPGKDPRVDPKSGPIRSA